MNYKTIYNEYQHSDYGWLRGIFIDNYARIISSILTMVALRLKLIPNVVTLFMILFGIIGAGLYALPELCFKILGVVFIHLWYIADLSDGEVAKITKRFSKYGTDIDFYAHMINHPLFIASFGWNFIQLGYDPMIVLALMFIYVTAELSIRIMTGIDSSHKADYSVNEPPKITLAYLLRFFIVNLCLFPNVALLLPIIILVSDKISFYLFIFLCIINLLYVVIRQIRRLITMVKV